MIRRVGARRAIPGIALLVLLPFVVAQRPVPLPGRRPSARCAGFSTTSRSSRQSSVRLGGGSSSGFTTQQLPSYDPNNPEASEEGGWLRFTVPGPGEYTAMWGDGDTPVLTMGVFTVD